MGEARRTLEAIASPRDPAWVGNYSEFLLEEGRVGDALQILRADESLLRGHPALHSNLIRTMVYDPDVSAEDLFHEARRWDAWHSAKGASPALRSPDPHRPLRIGYVSACMHRHNSSGHLLHLVQAHDKERFSVTLYSAGSVHDDRTDALRESADRWRDISHRSDEEAARQIRSDGIDILVDVNGHANNGRLRLFTHRPAPIQVHWYANTVTTGLEAMDWRFSTAAMEPTGEADQWSCERIARLPGGYHLCTPPSDPAAVAAHAPCRQNGFVTFGSAHSLAKLNTGVLRCWREILAAVPDARLLIVRDVLCEEETRVRLERRLTQAGIDSDRVRLSGNIPKMLNLEIYREMDLLLDAFPFSGDAITCDALSMGVPVITLAGDRLMSRHGAGILTLLGEEEWIARDQDDYVKRAVALGGAPERLAAAHDALPERFRRSVLCDHQRVAQGIEEHYRRMWTEG